MTENTAHAEEHLPGGPGGWVARRAALGLARVVEDRRTRE